MYKRAQRRPLPGYTVLGHLLLLMALLGSNAALAQRGVIDEVRLEDSAAGKRIRVTFTLPVQYVTHAPSRSGDELQVEYRLTPSPDTLDEGLPDTEQVQWEPTPGVPLREVTYEAMPTQETRNTAQGLVTVDVVSRFRLVFRFSRPVQFEVQPSTDFRSLGILLPGLPAAEPQATPGTAAAPAPASATAVPEYALNVMSSEQPISKAEVAALKKRVGQQVYTTSAVVNGRTWHRLRVGFFTTREQAELLRGRLKTDYPGAWTVKAGPQELARVTGSSAENTAPVEPEPAGDDAVEAEVGELMEQARQAMVSADYGRAVALYSKVLQQPSNSRAKEALELLGLARERNGQLAHAKAVYEQYLKRYPQGPDHERVKQRLAGLLTASLPEKKKLRAPRVARTEKKPGWETYGSFSQFYRRDTYQVNSQPMDTTQSALNSDLNLVARKRTSESDLQARVTAGHTLNLLHDGKGNDTRISALYVEGTDRKRDLSARLGRQTRSSGGVLGRFDGAYLGYRMSPKSKLNLVAGYPVDSSRDGFDSSRHFMGASVDLGTYADAWDFVGFAIQQWVDGVVDRSAVGGEMRYFKPNRSLFGLVDYDVHFSALNIAMLLGNWTLPNKVTLNASLDVRKSPILTTRNAIQSQGVTTVAELRTLYSDAEIKQLAKDRTPTSRTATFGATAPVSDRLQVSGDLTVTNFSSTPASGGVAATTGTGNEFYYNLQLIGNGILKEGDIAILGLRYSDGSTANTVSMFVNSRYPYNKQWRLNPRLRVDHRNYTSGDTQWTVAPSFRVEYRWERRSTFELEMGGEWSNRQLTTATERTTSFHANLGYRLEF